MEQLVQRKTDFYSNLKHTVVDADLEQYIKLSKKLSRGKSGQRRFSRRPVPETTDQIEPNLSFAATNPREILSL